MGRIVVITGGTSGIGLALKENFEKMGDTVLTFSLDEVDSNNHYNGSVSHEIKVRQVFNDIHEKYGNIDMLINCAGIGMSGITELVSIEDIHRLTEVNYYGTLYCVRSAIPFMQAGSRIINLSSAMALFPVPFRSIYGSVKSAVLNLSYALRMELAPLGIDVVAMCPGDTKTNFTKNRIKDFETNERYGDRLKTATEKSDSKEDKRMDCNDVAGKIFKVANLKKTKPFYIIGGKYKFWYFLSRFVSKNILLKCIASKMDGVYDENATKKKRKTENTKKEVVESEVVAEEVVQEQSVDVQESEEESLQATTETMQDSASVEQNTNEAQEVGSANAEEKVEMPEVQVEAKEEPENSANEQKSTGGLGGLLSKMTGLKKPSEQSTSNENKSE